MHVYLVHLLSWLKLTVRIKWQMILIWSLPDIYNTPEKDCHLDNFLNIFLGDLEIIYQIYRDCGIYRICAYAPALTLGCVEGEVDGLLCTQCAVSEGSDGHCILSHCLQTWQGPTCVCCVSYCRCPIQPVNVVHEGPHVWGCWSVPMYLHTGRDRACQAGVEGRPWTGCGWEWR